MASDDESAFQRRADQLIASIAAAAEAQLQDHAEVELQAGVLQLDFDDRVYVVNKHAPTRQVWLSSPLSGAWHFSWNETQSGWRDTRHGEDILALLRREWTGMTSIDVIFDA